MRVKVELTELLCFVLAALIHRLEQARARLVKFLKMKIYVGYSRY